MYIILDMLFALVSCIIFSLLNLRGLVDEPQFINNSSIFSILFLFIWFIYGFLIGKINRRNYLYFVVVFWISGLILSTLCALQHSTLFYLLSFMFIGPLNGFKYLKIYYMYGYPFFIFNIILPMLITIIGYYTGKIYYRKNKCNLSL